MRRWLSLGLVLGLTMMAGRGNACRYQAQSLKASAAQAEVVFIARAESSSNDMSGKLPLVPASMRVVKVVKGAGLEVGQTVALYTSSSSCGLGIARGQLWLVLAGGHPLTSDQPSGSVLLTDPAARKLVAQELGVTP